MTPDELKTQRKAANLTQQQLGEALGFPKESARGRVSDYETGRRGITPAVAVAINSILAK